MALTLWLFDELGALIKNWQTQSPTLLVELKNSSNLLYFMVHHYHPYLSPFCQNETTRLEQDVSCPQMYVDVQE